MAVSFNNSDSFSTGSTNNHNISYTVNTGINRYLIFTLYLSSTNDLVNSVSYNGVQMTLLTTRNLGSERAYHYYLINPDIGTNTLNVSLSTAESIIGTIAQYDGVSQTPPVAAEERGVANQGTVISESINNPNNDSWVLMSVVSRSPVTLNPPHTNWNLRELSPQSVAFIGDTNAGQSIGNITQTINLTFSSVETSSNQQIVLKSASATSDSFKPKVIII